jgi:hypothetical protein
MDNFTDSMFDTYHLFRYSLSTYSLVDLINLCEKNRLRTDGPKEMLIHNLSAYYSLHNKPKHLFSAIYNRIEYDLKRLLGHNSYGMG